MPATTICTTRHSPPNTFSTTVYQSRDVGRKMNPSKGNRIELNKPSNHGVKNQRPRITSLGTNRARRASRQGMIAGTVLAYGCVYNASFDVCGPVELQKSGYVDKKRDSFTCML